MYLKASRGFGSLPDNRSSEIRGSSKQDVRDFGESAILADRGSSFNRHAIETYAYLAY